MNTFTDTIQNAKNYFLIDTFQSSKKWAVNQIFKDEILKNAAHAYIDAQTQFAKMIVNNTVNLSKYSVESVSKILFPQKQEESAAPYKVEPKEE
jgi:hypothetical protein